MTSKILIEPKDPSLKPRIEIKDERGRTVKVPGTNHDAVYFLPVKARIVVEEGEIVQPGDLLAKIPKESTKMRDITGGLPRVVELFEARKPKKLAKIAEIDGIVKIVQEKKGKTKIIVMPRSGKGMKAEYDIPKGKYISVRDGDYIEAGTPLMEGAPDPHDILKLGVHKLATYLVDEIQQVYRLQGVRIHDKHIEVIVRQMLRWLKITDPGDSQLLEGEYIDKRKFDEINRKLEEEGKKPASGEPTLLGITRASLNVESFISAASFQETTKVLTEAALAGKTDYLKGLKENAIIGGLIPAGTGFPILNRNVDVKILEQDEDTEDDDLI